MCGSLGWPAGKNSSLTPPTSTAQHLVGCPRSVGNGEGAVLTRDDCSVAPSPLRPTTEGRSSDVEILSQHVDEESRIIDPGPLVPFAYRDLPLAAADLSTAGSQLLSNLNEDYQGEG